jgi:hypothetical protein
MNAPLGGLLLVAALVGPGSVGCGPAHAPPYTEEELARLCALRGGWWRPDQLRGGDCEFEAPGFL